MRRVHVRQLTAVLLAGAFLLAGCDDSPTEPPLNPTPDAVEVSPESVTLTETGATEQLTAVVYDEDGDEIEDAEVTWSSSDEEVATVDEDGLVEAVGEGTATITATSGEASGTAEVTVEIED
jgi:uncharacterized protein YjdB